jgi:formate dehydrogenase maturation protein FdhE
MANEFERVWERFESLTEDATTKDIAELFYRKGICDGKEQVLSEIRPLVLSPEDAVKLESQTIGKTIRYEHLGDVIEAKKHVS